MNMTNLLVAGIAVAKPVPEAGVVVTTGLILVFSVLVLLYFLVTVQGKIFTAIDNKKKGKQEVLNQAPKAAPQAVVLSAAKPLMQIEKGIQGDVVAAIAAAISCLDGGNYTIKSVKRAKQSGRNAWGQAGVISYTEPF